MHVAIKIHINIILEALIPSKNLNALFNLHAFIQIIIQMHTVKGLNSISAHSSIHRKVEYRKAMHQQNMSETPLKTITLVHLNL